MEKIIKGIAQKLDKIDERMDKVDITLAKQEVNLKEHMRRTALLEAQHENLKDALVPVNSHIHQIKGAIKFIGILSTLLAVSGALVKVFNIV